MERNAPGQGIPTANRRLRLPLHLFLALLFLLVLGLVTLAAAAVANRQADRLVEQAVSATVEGSARLALEELNRLEAKAVAAAEALAADAVTGRATRADRAAGLNVLATLLRTATGVSAAYVGWPNGDFMLLRPIGPDATWLEVPTGARWLLQWVDVAGPSFEFLDDRLALIDRRPMQDFAFDPRLRPWYVEALASAETIVTAPYTFFTTGEPGITAARRSTSGSIAGVDVSFADLSARLSGGQPVASAFTAILDGDGAVLAHSDRAALTQAIAQWQGTALPNGLIALPPATFLASPILTELSALPTPSDTFSLTLRVAGRDWRARVEPLAPGRTHFVIAAPLDELRAGPLALRDRMLLLLIAAMLLGTPLVWGAAYLASRPVRQFVAQAEAAAALDFTPPPATASRIAELADLGDALAILRASLGGFTRIALSLTERDAVEPILAGVLDGLIEATGATLGVGWLEAGTDEDETPPVARHPDGRDASPPADLDLADLRARLGDATAPLTATLPDGRTVLLVPLRAAGGDALGVLAVLLPAAAPPLPPRLLAMVAAVAPPTALVLDRLRLLDHQRTLDAHLRQTQKLEALGQLTGGVAHDFNNLLTVILCNAEGLAEAAGDNRKLKALAELTGQAASRGAALTGRLLAFARRQPLSPKLVDLNVLVADMEELLRRAVRWDIDIALEPAPDLWPCVIDPGQFEVSLLNLALNARDAIPGTGRLTIATANADLDEPAPGPDAPALHGRFVRLTVSDTGQGMSAEVARRAFDPFFTTKEVGKGTGLGLSMVFGFVRQSGGDVRIASEPGAGAAVTLYFPAADGTVIVADPPDTRPNAPAPVGDAEPTHRGGHILLVEDDPLIREQSARQLEELGYRITTAATVETALERLAALPDIDMLFTDIVMPGGGNGCELALTASARHPALKILLTSGYSDALAESAGNRFPLLPKPYGRKDLARTVARLL